MNHLRAYFEDLAARWDELQPENREQVLLRLLMPFAPLLTASRTILEVGTGTGALIPCLRTFAPEARLISIDLAFEMLRRARRRCPNATVVQADVHHLPFIAPWFNLVVCHNSFPHFANKPAALDDLRRVLYPGGCLLILHDLSREQVNAIHTSAAEAIKNDLLPPGAEMAQMLKRVGFADVQVHDTEHSYLAAAIRP